MDQPITNPQAEASIAPVPKVITEQSDATLIAQWKDNTAAVATNITPDTPRGRGLMTRCLATADLKTRNAVGQHVEATHFFAHIAEVMNKQTGEVSQRVRVVLVLKDGRTLSTMSGGCVKALGLIASATHYAEWNPPIMLEFREFPTEDGKSYCDVREVVREEGKKK